ncbi:Arginyl-tRNA--protein transferase 1 [Tulasnella sp. 427]|nr:Arginyl-tRNA--protein transferase 1 [Tulasnella sp. 427]
MAQDEDQDADDRAQGDEEPFSLAQPYGPRASTCGYCGPPGGRSLTRSSFTFGIDAVQLSCLVTLEPSSFTEEKFRLFCEYQRSVHKDDDKSRQGFKSFLCETPLKRQRIRYSKQPPAHLPAEYGSYHQMYRVDGELIAVGVVDVLPYCVSSVYLMYSPKWETHSLGKLSALKEIALAQEMSAYGAPGMGYLYMGFYIHTCPKMKYKGQYAPSFLLDPEEYTWCPTEKAFPLLDKHLYVPFHDPTRASKINPGNRTTQDDDASAEPIDEAEDDMSDTEEADSASAFQLPDEVLARVEIGQISGGTIYTMPAQPAYWEGKWRRA